QNIDYLVLGCTHYPLLKNQIKKIVPQHVQIIDSGEAIAKRIKTVLEENKMMNTTSVHQQLFYTNKDADLLRNLLPEQAKNVSFLDYKLHKPTRIQHIICTYKLYFTCKI